MSANGATERTAGFLADRRDSIVAAATAALVHAHARHYDDAGPDEVRRRLEELFDRVVEALRGRDLRPLVAFAHEIAEQRYLTGYELTEVQAAFNAFEEAAWARVLADLPPERHGEALGLVSTVVGSGKDELARAYTSLAAGRRSPSLDLRALFS